MTEYQTISVIIAAVSAFGSIVSAAAATVAAVGIWVGIKAMNRANEARAAQAAADRKATQATLAAIEELIRRTAPPQSGPAE